MEETMIWGAGLVAEILLAAIVVFVVLLRRSRKAQRKLLAQLANHEIPPAEHVVAEIPVVVEISEAAVTSAEVAVEPPPVDAPQIAPLQVEAELPKATDAAATTDFDQLLKSIDNTGLDESVKRLQQRLEATTQSLQRLSPELLQALTSSEQGDAEFASLQLNIQEITQEVDSLQQSNAQLQQDLRQKTQALEQTAAARREHEELVVQHAKKLRGDVVKLRDKLKNSEGDVERLQSEKEALAAEYAALSREYERIYSKVEK